MNLDLQSLTSLDLQSLTSKEIDLNTYKLQKGDIVKIKHNYLEENEENNFHIVMESVHSENNNYVYLTEICDFNLKALFPSQLRTRLEAIEPILYGNCL